MRNFEERMRNGDAIGGDNRELQEFSAATMVTDMKFSGQLYTWGDRKGEGALFCKLDRAMVNDLWLTKFSNSECIFQVPDSSDHSPGVVRLGNEGQHMAYPFKYCIVWSTDDRFQEIVREAWDVEVRGTPMYCFVTKLKGVKKGLKGLHMNEYSRMEERIQVQKLKLEEVQEALLRGGGSRELWDREQKLRADYTKLVQTELSLLKQKAKREWVKGVDISSAYFYATIKEQQSRNRITSICREDDTRVFDEEEIAGEFTASSRTCLALLRKD